MQKPSKGKGYNYDILSSAMPATGVIKHDISTETSNLTSNGPDPCTEINVLIGIDPNHTVLKRGYFVSAAEKRAISLLREQVQAAHQLLDGTVGDVTPEEAHWSPPG